VSNRDDQDAERNWVRGKAFDNSAPIGPVMATPEDVPEAPRVRLWLNGEKRQDSDDDELVFDVGRAISEVSTFLTLEPGDIVAMGTTVGVGPPATVTPWRLRSKASDDSNTTSRPDQFTVAVPCGVPGLPSRTGT